MGIKGLWKALKPYVRDGHLSQFRGQRIAIDMYVWLHQCLHDSVSVDRKRLIKYFEEKEKRKLHEYEQRQQAKLKEEIVISDNDDDGNNNDNENKVKCNHSQKTLASESSSSSETQESSSRLIDNDLLTINDIIVILPSFISSVMSKLDSVLKFGIIPVCVFDGASMPMKVSTDTARAAFRQRCFKEAVDLLEQLYDRNRRYAMHQRHGHHNENTLLSRHASAFQEAVQLLEKAVDVSPELAQALIHVITSERQVECLIAPYEADAQLSYLCREGFVQACISEDSDLIAYQCPTIIAKLDYYSGRCEVLRAVECAPLFYNEIAASVWASANNVNSGSNKRQRNGDRESKSEKISPCTLSTPSISLTASTSNEMQSKQQHTNNFDIASSTSSSSTSDAAASSLASFTYESFLLACIMSGCDYLSNLRSIGVKTAFKLVATANSLPHLMSMLESNFHFASEELRSYQKLLLSAFYCFAHHLVYCPRQGKLVHYHPLPRVHCCPSSSQPSPSPHSTCHCSEEVKKTNMITSKPRAELIGSVWSPELATSICVKCSVDPATHKSYTGMYESCIETYMKAIKRGQTSLKSYAGFEKQDTSKIIIKMSSLNAKSNVDHLTNSSSGNTHINNKLNASPLKKVCEGVGYIGSGTSSNYKNNGSAYERWGRGAMIVRSKYFVHHDRAFSSEPDTQSEESDRAEGTPEHVEGATPTKKRNRLVESCENNTNSVDKNESCRKLIKMEDCYTTEETEDETGETEKMQCALRKENVNTTNQAMSALESQKLSLSSEDFSTMVDTQLTSNDSNFYNSATSFAVGAALSSKTNTVLESPTSSCNSSSPELLGSEAKSYVQTMETCEEDSVNTNVTEKDNIAIIGGSDDDDDDKNMYCTKDVHTHGHWKEKEKIKEEHSECCQCPYGYWQCNRSHSIFDKCFANKQWIKGEKPIIRAFEENSNINNRSNTQASQIENGSKSAMLQCEEDCSNYAKHKKSKAKLAIMQPYVPRSLSAKHDSQGSSTITSTSSASKTSVPSLFTPFRAPRSSQSVKSTKASTNNDKDAKESTKSEETVIKQPSTSLFAQLSFRKHVK